MRHMIQMMRMGRGLFSVSNRKKVKVSWCVRLMYERESLAMPRNAKPSSYEKQHWGQRLEKADLGQPIVPVYFPFVIGQINGILHQISLATASTSDHFWINALLRNAS